MTITIDADLHRLFREQHGAASDRQIRAAGVDRRQQQRLISAGVWARAAPGVVVANGAPAVWKQRASIAVLASGPGAALSHGSACRLDELDGYASYEDLHVTVPHGARPSRAGVHQHTLVGLTAGDRHRRDGIEAVRMPLALIGVIAVDGADAAAKAFDSALRLGFPPLWFVQTAQRWRAPGRAGPTQLLELVAERTTRRLPRSWFERLARRALAAAGIAMTHEHAVLGVDGRVLAVLDLADVERRIGVECQSWEWHATPAAQRADAVRKRALRRLGWEIVDVWWSDLRRIDDVAATIEAIIAERRLPG